MSRSYKKHPFCTDGKAKSTALSKRFANKVVRQYKHKIVNGKAYKHLFCSYDIHDCIIRYTCQEMKQKYENDSSSYLRWQCSSLKELYNHWSKYYKRK